jgi:hypothetical protein
MKLLRNMQQTLDSDGKNPFETIKPDSQHQNKRNTASGSAFNKPSSPGKAKERLKHNVDLLPT